MDNASIFHRPALAADIAGSLLGYDPLFNTGRSGLFLAAPRRTGKTTFLKSDLIPAVEQNQHGLVVYVDLWADVARSPADLIAEAVREKLAQLSKTWKPVKALVRLRKLSVSAKLGEFEAALGFEIEAIGKPGGTTLANAFEGLHKTAGKPIVLIIDEAQHAMGSKDGRTALLALKAARDALNATSDRPRLAILATGSVRGKLADLVHKKTQAFYGATLNDFPLLGEDFVAHLVDQMLSHRLSSDELPPTAKVMEAFKVLGHRPEELRKVIAAAYTRPEPFTEAIVAGAHARRKELIADLAGRFDELQDLQKAILQHMAVQGVEYRPFSGEAVELYQRATGDPDLNWARVQKALQWLVRDEFVWQSARGTYGIDDRILADYLAEPEAMRVLTGGTKRRRPSAKP